MTRWLPLIGLLSLAASARADIPPDPRSMAADCALETQCAGGRGCPVGLRVDEAESSRCTDAAEAAGLVYRCRGGGNYVGTAVYCPADAPGACTLEAQCPGGKTCRSGEDCDVNGHYWRCGVPVRGTPEWQMVYCPVGVEPPAPGRNASASALGSSGGCGCSAGATTSRGLFGVAVIGVAMLVGLRRRGVGSRSSRARAGDLGRARACIVPSRCACAVLCRACSS